MVLQVRVDASIPANTEEYKLAEAMLKKSTWWEHVAAKKEVDICVSISLAFRAVDCEGCFC